jgi:beta-aspartyl-dipeptidase (metallo-type)
VPGFVDPHAHLIGAAGENGFGSRTPEIRSDDLISAGVTTVSGCIGTDTTTRGLRALFGKTRQLEADGLTAHMYTGGFPVPPPTITGSIVDDLVIVAPVLGVGEIAISDARSSHPSATALAGVASEALIGGSLSGKAGLTHVHVGPAEQRLALLRSLLDEFDIPPRHLYPTHVNRTPRLVEEAAALARRGSFVDMDTVDGDLDDHLRCYLEYGGPMDHLTVSSDAHTQGATPRGYYDAFASCVQHPALSLDMVLPCFTFNSATALGLPHKGRVAAGADADLLILESESLRIEDVLCRGEWLMRDGLLVDSMAQVI